VVVGVVLGAVTSMISLLQPQVLQAMQGFLLGSTAFVSWTACATMAAVLTLCVVLAWVFARVLDALSLGEATAQSLGVPLVQARMVLVGVISLATGASVAHIGLVAFVGLAAPHLVRSLVRSTHAGALLLSALMGGLLLVVADVWARVLFAPQELPVGVLTAVIGGGNSGVEAAIDLAGIVAHVTLIEFDSQLRADAVLQTKLRSLPNLDIITSALSTEVIGDGEKVQALLYTDRNTDESHRIDLDGIFVQIGLVPNTEWLKGPLTLSPRGEIEIDAHNATNIPGVFAAGDVTTVPYKQIIVAMGEGTKAGLSAFDHIIRH
jgi:hypothetical protein